MEPGNAIDFPPLGQVRTILAAARTGSFSAAGEALGLTHGAVSRQVAQLEAWLGTKLFERHGRGVRPTPDGQRFITRAEAALGMLADTAQQWRPRRGPEVVRLSILPAFAKLWLLERLKALEAAAGGVRLELQIAHGLADLMGGAADLAIRCGRSGGPDLAHQRLMAEWLVPVAVPDLLDPLRSAADPVARARLLARLPLIHDSDATGWRSWFAALGVTYRPKPADRRFEDSDVVLAVAAAGLGVALARLPLAEPWLAGRALVRLDGPPRVANPVAYHIIWRPQETRAAILATREALIAAAEMGGCPG